MVKYNLVNVSTKATFFDLTQKEVVEKLRNETNLRNWYYWNQGLPEWKKVTQSMDLKTWLSFQWDETQKMPQWTQLFDLKQNDFEVVEFEDASVANPPPPPPPEKTEFVVSSFSGQVYDFDESLKDKHLNTSDFKIVDDASRFEKTVKMDSTTADFEKTVSSNTQLINELTVNIGTSSDSDKTILIESKSTSLPDDKNVNTNLKTEADTEKTVTVTKENTSFDKTMRIDKSSFEFESTVTLKNPNYVPEVTSKVTTPDRAQPTSNAPKAVPVPDKAPPLAPDMNVIKEPVQTPNVATVQAKTPEINQTGNDTANEAVVKKHNRRYPRIKGRLRTIITNKSKAFMTFTKDISLGGIQVENSIPADILNSEIEVYISDPSGKKSILFRCHPVGENQNPCRFSFAKADEKNLQKLSQWLDDLVKTSAA